jgi:hypothetical protein
METSVINAEKKRAKEEAERDIRNDRMEKRRMKAHDVQDRFARIDFEDIIDTTLDEDDLTFTQALGTSMMSCILPELKFSEACALLLSTDPSALHSIQNRLAQWTHSYFPTPPSLRALLAFKDYLMIPDQKWSFVRKTFGLGNDYSLSLVKALQKEMTSQLAPQKTPGSGYVLPLIKYMRLVLQENKGRFDPKKPIFVKFAFDGATMTRGKKIKQEIGTFEFLSGHETLKKAKSLYNGHQFFIYVGEESQQNLELELSSIRRFQT